MYGEQLNTNVLFEKKYFRASSRQDVQMAVRVASGKCKGWSPWSSPELQDLGSRHFPKW